MKKIIPLIFLMTAVFAQPGSDMSNCVCNGKDLSDTDFTEADFTGADLSGANLSGSNFTDANFTDANLSGADLTHADLTRTLFESANLPGADLSHADLSQTKFYRANLTSVNYAYTNFDDANVTGANLNSAGRFGKKYEKMKRLRKRLGKRAREQNTRYEEERYEEERYEEDEEYDESEDIIKQLSLELFYSISTDGEHINRKTWSNWRKENKPAVTSGKTIFKAVDVTNDGKINQKEFYKFYIRLVKE